MAERFRFHVRIGGLTPGALWKPVEQGFGRPFAVIPAIVGATQLSDGSEIFQRVLQYLLAYSNSFLVWFISEIPDHSFSGGLGRSVGRVQKPLRRQHTKKQLQVHLACGDIAGGVSFRSFDSSVVFPLSLRSSVWG